MKILVQSSDDTPRELEEGFANERELQTFLKDHCELMPMEDIDLSAPPLLCIGWEVRVGDNSEDILYLDENGLLTIVETKLKKNPEARRAVVGQILEYAAETVLWTPRDVENRAEAFFASNDCQPEYRNQALENAMRTFLERVNSPLFDVFSYDDFLGRITQNLRLGHVRLIIALDEPPPTLVKTVEFINRFAQSFEMFVFQLKRFRDDEKGLNVFVPALFGKVGGGDGPGPGPKTWNEDSFMQHLRANRDGETIEYTSEIYEEFRSLTDEPLWGSGSTFGSFSLVAIGSSRANVAQITSLGVLYVNFEYVTPKTDRQVTQQLLDRLNEIPGVALPELERIERKNPRIPESVLRDPGRRQKVLSAITEAFEAIRAA